MGDQHNMGDNGYMEQDEEWEREGLLDPAWEKQQRKVSQLNAMQQQYSHLVFYQLLNCQKQELHTVNYIIKLLIQLNLCVVQMNISNYYFLTFHLIEKLQCHN